MDILGNIKIWDTTELINFQTSQLWIIGAHKESIRHIHYIDIIPRIIVTPSHDLRIKIFGADDGSDQEEFKQIANRTKPIFIGIKYSTLNIRVLPQLRNLLLLLEF